MARACAAAGGEELLHTLLPWLKASHPSPNLSPSTQTQRASCSAQQKASHRLAHGLLLDFHAFRSSRAVGIASNLSGPVPISPLYGSWQSEAVYSCSLPGMLPPMAPVPLDLNQRQKSSEAYFNLHHSVIFLLQGEFNFKISPSSPDKAGPFPFLEFLLIAPSLQPVALCRESAPPSCTILGPNRESFTAAPWGAESLQSWALHDPWGPAQTSHTSTSRRMRRPLISPGKLMWDTTAWTQADP